MSRRNKLLIGTNTKMYKTISDTVSFLKKLEALTQDIDRSRMELFVIPSYTTLERAGNSVNQELIKLGAQNMGWEEQGQFTGEISPLMLKEVGVNYIMIGHSERRHVLGETDAQENKKVLCSLEHGFTTLLCVGETKEQKELDISNEILRIQLKSDLYQVKQGQTEKLIIAYEPVWAIGVAGVPASKEYADAKHKVIKDTLVEIFGEDAGSKIPVLYGGSVNNENATEIIRMPHVDGLFIGRSAWDAKNFNEIIRAVLPLYSER